MFTIQLFFKLESDGKEIRKWKENCFVSVSSRPELINYQVKSNKFRDKGN